MIVPVSRLTVGGRVGPCDMLARLTLGLLLVAATPAGAQTPPTQLPGAVEPGRREAPQPELRAAPLKLRWTIDLPAGVEPPEALAGETLTVKDLNLQGVSVYERADLLPIFEPVLGREITFAEFYGVARAIQERYQRDGYILSFAYIPPQTVADDVYTISVVEGYVDKVLVEDAEGTLRATLEDILAPLTRSRPLHSDTLERYMLLADDLAGVKVTGVLQPSKEARAASDLIVKVVHHPVDGGLRIDNRGSEFTGPWQGTANFAVNSVLGRGERVALSATVTRRPRELKSIALTLSQPLGYEGLVLSAGGGYTRAEPGFTLKRFAVETETIHADLDLSYPIIRTRAQTLTAAVGFSYLNTVVDLLGVRFSRDRIRTAGAGLTYSENGFLGGASRVTLGLAQALDILAASDPDEDLTSRADSEPTFTKVGLDVVRSQPLFGGLDLMLSATAQYAFAPLPAAEEFALGGARYGRAYNPGEITGENGVAASVEVGYGLVPDDPLILGVKPYGFYDFGKAWDERTGSSLGLAHSLSSAGFGVRIDLIRGVTLDFEYAHPLTRTPSNQSGGKQGRFFVFIGARF